MQRSVTAMLICLLMILSLSAARAAEKVDLDGPLYGKILSEEERARTVTAQRYEGDDFPRAKEESLHSDWILRNLEYAPERIGLRRTPKGEPVLKFYAPRGEPARYTASLRFPWNHGEKGTVHVASVEMAADYTSYAGFKVHGPGTFSGINVSRYYKDEWAKFRLEMQKDGKDDNYDITPLVDEKLGERWNSKDFHTYTLKWIADGGSTAPFDLYVDGVHVLNYTGRRMERDRDPGLSISFQSGRGGAQIKAVEWVQVPPAGAAAEGPPTVLAFRGMGFNRLQFADIEETIGRDRMNILDLRMVTIYLAPGGGPKMYVPRPAQVPADHQLARTAGFFLCDAPANVLGQRLTGAIERRVAGGASLLVTGGPQAFGRGGYSGSALEELLPVRAMDTVWDVEELPEPAKLTVVAGEDVLGGLEWAAGPTVEYIQRTELKPDAEVLVRAGERHVLTRRKVGQGYVYAWTAPAWGSAESGFWSWPDWPKLCVALLNIEPAE